MEYEEFLELLKYRRTIRRFKRDPIPGGYVEKILDAAHYSMSGANSQPWEFIVVRDSGMKKKVYEGYLRGWETCYYFEQQRIPQYRHPAFNVLPEEKEKAKLMGGGWQDAPVYILVLGDPRKQMGTVLIGGPGMRNCPTFLESMGHLCMTIQLAAASLGLGSQRVDVGEEQAALKEALGIPDPLFVDIIVPIGYRAYEPGPPHRLPLETMVHYEKYDVSKYLRPEDILKYNERIRELGRPGYRVAVGEGKG